MKITPAHDFNDFKVGQRHGLEMINILDRRIARAWQRQTAPAASQLSAASTGSWPARPSWTSSNDWGCCAASRRPATLVPHGDRSGVVVEPFLTDQWYVDAKTLAQPAIKAVEQGDTVFTPQELGEDLFRVAEEHRALVHLAPALVGPPHPGLVWAGRRDLRGGVRGRGPGGGGGPLRRDVELRQDEDVLDTWFSSALWPFSTLGWPEETADLKRFYPTTTLVTGFDIIFFWVARMMMMGLHFMGEVPFRGCSSTPWSATSTGQKMSKSKGNVIDPLELVDEYGADALRFTLTAMSGQARDIKPLETAG